VPKAVVLGEFEQFVLSALLLVEDEPYALKLREELRRLTGRAVGRGTLYRTLDRLTQKGYVKASVEKGGAERRGHLRRRYAVTARGRAVLRSSRDTWLGVFQRLSGVLG
jgi:DNA-binding PadR family transcriptional regulator